MYLDTMGLSNSKQSGSDLIKKEFKFHSNKVITDISILFLKLGMCIVKYFPKFLKPNID